MCKSLVQLARNRAVRYARTKNLNGKNDDWRRGACLFMEIYLEHFSLYGFEFIFISSHMRLTTTLNHIHTQQRLWFNVNRGFYFDRNFLSHNLPLMAFIHVVFAHTAKYIIVSCCACKRHAIVKSASFSVAVNVLLNSDLFSFSVCVCVCCLEFPT